MMIGAVIGSRLKPSRMSLGPRSHRSTWDRHRLWDRQSPWSRPLRSPQTSQPMASTQPMESVRLRSHCSPGNRRSRLHRRSLLPQPVNWQQTRGSPQPMGSLGSPQLVGLLPPLVPAVSSLQLMAWHVSNSKWMHFVRSLLLGQSRARHSMWRSQIFHVRSWAGRGPLRASPFSPAVTKCDGGTDVRPNPRRVRPTPANLGGTPFSHFGRSTMGVVEGTRHRAKAPDARSCGPHGPS